MNRRQLARLGLPEAALAPAEEAVAASGWSASVARTHLAALIREPWKFCDDPHFGALAQLLKPAEGGSYPERDLPPWPNLCDSVLAGSLLNEARRLPLAVAGALLPDGQPGLGLPVGGVLATRNAVIPRAVGSDVGCQMRLSVFEERVGQWHSTKVYRRLREILRGCTLFGLTAGYEPPLDHPVLAEDWSLCEAMRHGRKLRECQLGTSGTGNHFVEFGSYEDGRLAFLSHSGSRGIGAATALEFHQLALKARPDLPRELRAWAWLDLDSEAGTAYWSAMELLVRYARACHDLIHARVYEALQAQPVQVIECVHNLATRENGLVVHRKGTIRVGKGELGLIAGTMAAPSYVVRGLGYDLTLDSASHGCGRIISRGMASRTARGKVNGSAFHEARSRSLHEAGVKVLNSSHDEAPQVYRNIQAVLAAQRAIVEPVGCFQPKIVLMCGDGQTAEG